MTKRTVVAIDSNAAIKAPNEYGETVDGVRIILSDGSTIEFGIEMGQSCCEHYDFLSSPDDASEFIGAEFLGLVERDTWPDTIPIDSGIQSYSNPAVVDCDSGGFQAIDVNTSKGTMQFVVYNAHNGYYSHATVLIGEGINKTEYL